MSLELRERFVEKWSKKFSKDKEITFEVAMHGALKEYGEELELQSGISAKIKSLEDELIASKKSEAYWQGLVTNEFLRSSTEYWNSLKSGAEATSSNDIIEQSKDHLSEHMDTNLSPVEERKADKSDSAEGGHSDTNTASEIIPEEDSK